MLLVTLCNHLKNTVCISLLRFMIILYNIYLYIYILSVWHITGSVHSLYSISHCSLSIILCMMQTTRFVLNIVIEYIPQRCGRHCGMFCNICMICEIGIFQSKGNANISHCPEIIEILVVPDIVIHLYQVETSISFNILATRWLFCCINKMGGMLLPNARCSVPFALWIYTWQYQITPSKGIHLSKIVPLYYIYIYGVCVCHKRDLYISVMWHRTGRVHILYSIPHCNLPIIFCMVHTMQCLSQWSGVRPTNDISIDFKIW